MPATAATALSPAKPSMNRSAKPLGSQPVLRSREAASSKKAPPSEHEILFQRFFKSIGPRTYAVQVKKARNGNHYLVLTEGQRDEKTGAVRKSRVFVFSEDFVEFFRLIKGAAEFVKEHPVPPEVRDKQQKRWAAKCEE